MAEIKQVILVRRDLSEMNKSSGKIISQCCHASMKVVLDQMDISFAYGFKIRKLTDHIEPAHQRPISLWIDNSFTKIVLGVDSLDELRELEKKAIDLGIINAVIVDNGLTVFNGEKTVTCMAIGPDYSSKIDEVTGHLKLL